MKPFIKKELIVNTIIFMCIIVCDQVTKLLSINLYKIIIPNILDIKYVENKGAAFSTFETKTVLIISLIFIIALLIYWRRTKSKTIKNIALTLMLSGSIGNLIDRMFRGFVIDFIKITLNDNLPVFNIADISIAIGFFMLVCYYSNCLIKNKES